MSAVIIGGNSKLNIPGRRAKCYNKIDFIVYSREQ